ncbi:unnamed protein product, partial [Trichogramma brassicae]
YQFSIKSFSSSKQKSKKCTVRLLFALIINKRTYRYTTFGLLAVIECLEKRGYKLDQSEVLIIMKLFDKYKLFEAMKNLDERWYDVEKFAKEARETMVKPDLSLYDLIHLRPHEAAKRLTYMGCYKLTESAKPDCFMHLYEMMSSKFFRSWASESFWKLIHYRLPVEICELIIEQLTNKDLYHIFLAAEGLTNKDEILVSIYTLCASASRARPKRAADVTASVTIMAGCPQCPCFTSSIMCVPILEAFLEPEFWPYRGCAREYRSEEHIERIEKYLRAVKLIKNYDDPSQDPIFSEVVTLDLATVVSSVSGPKRPHERIHLLPEGVRHLSGRLSSWASTSYRTTWSAADCIHPNTWANYSKEFLLKEDEDKDTKHLRRLFERCQRDLGNAKVELVADGQTMTTTLLPMVVRHCNPN